MIPGQKHISISKSDDEEHCGIAQSVTAQIKQPLSTGTTITTSPKSKIAAPSGGEKIQQQKSSVCQISDFQIFFNYYYQVFSDTSSG